MSIDVIVVTYNAKKNLKKCVESIFANTCDVPYRLTIVDNHCTDGSFLLLKNYGKKINIIVNQKNLGFSGGANSALKLTFGKYVALVDDDAEVPKGWLKQLYKKINESTAIGIVGCKIIFPNKLIFCAEMGASYGHYQVIGYGEKDSGQRNYVKEVNAVNGACWLMRRTVVRKIGYFDEQFFPCQLEDLDYCLRARQVGFKVVYDGGLSIIHHHLYREGGMKTMLHNYRKFFTKWKRCAKKFAIPELPDGVFDGDKPFKARDLESMALEAEQQGKYAAAINYLKRAVCLNPRNHVACYYLAKMYKKTGQRDKAKLAGHQSLDIFGYINNRCVAQLRRG